MALFSGLIFNVHIISFIETDFLYWADNDHGTITRIHRDGTERQTVVEQYESLDNIPVDWMSGKDLVYY